MRRLSAFAIALLAAALSGSFAPGQQPLPTQSASQIMALAETQASNGHKNIIVIFSASWCGPCHMLERFFSDRKVTPILGQNFVVAKLDVGERSYDTHHANTPGGPELMTALGGETAGFPFFAITDSDGKKLVNSLRPDKDNSSNIGYPDTVPQIEWFLQMLQTSAPALTPKQVKSLRNSLLDQTEH